MDMARHLHAQSPSKGVPVTSSVFRCLRPGQEVAVPRMISRLRPRSFHEASFASELFQVKGRTHLRGRLSKDRKREPVSRRCVAALYGEHWPWPHP